MIFCTLLSIAEIAKAQDGQIVHLNSKSYEYIQLLQYRGYFDNLNPTDLPYKRGEVNQGLQEIDYQDLEEVERFWFDQISTEVGYEREREDIYMSGVIDGGLDLNNTLNDNGLRPQADQVFLMPNGAMKGYIERNDIAVQLGLKHDLFYDYDRLGVNALSRYYVRNEDYYMGYNGDFLNIYVGRYDKLWAPYGETSTILGQNARSFDQLGISFNHDWFKISGVFGELDNLGKDGTFDRGTTEEDSKNLIDGTKRYMALHRVDFKLTDNLRLGYFDGFVYSSEHSVASLEYLTPLNIFFFDRNTNPKNDEFNAFFGGQLWWQHRRLTVNLQAMIDDIVIKGGRVESQIEPTTFAFTHSLNIARVTDFIDVGYEAELISYQTYNTDQAEGRYLYLKRGIANQYTDYAFFSGYAKIHAHRWVKGLSFEPTISYLAQGEQEINQPFTDRYPNGEVIDVILTGTEEKMSRIGVDILYNPIPEFWFDASVGYNYTNNHEHITGQTHTRITARVEAGFRISFDN